MIRFPPALLLLLMFTAAGGCDSADESKSTSAPDEKPATTREPKIPGPGEIVLEQDLHVALARFNSEYNGQAQVKLGLSGEIVDVTIAGCGVSDLSGLTNLRLNGLEARQNAIDDLRPLKDMPLRVLYLGSTNVRDLSPLAGLPLDSLWLDDTPVEDIGPLKETPLVSLTLKGTLVSDLRSLNGSRLLRLNIENTSVTDLTSLEGMRLTRLVFDPRRIKKGLDVVRKMTTLNELGLDLNTLMRPEQFWKRYDSGELLVR